MTRDPGSPPIVPLEAAPAGPAGAMDLGQAAGAAGDPFPHRRLLAVVRRLPRYLRLAWGLAGEPRLSRGRKAGVLAAAGYLASPIDLIPGIIPVVGQLDDIAVALLALRAALRALDPATRRRHLAAAGLTDDDLDDDLRTLGALASWLLRRGVAVGLTLAILAGRAGVRAARAGVVAARRYGPPAGRAGVRAAAASARAAARAGRAGVRALPRGWPGNRAVESASSEAGIDPGSARDAEEGAPG